MPITTHTVQAGGCAWTFTTLPATQGLEVFTQLTAIMGAATGQLSGGFKPGLDMADQDIDPNVLGAALGAVGMKLAEPGTVAMIKALLQSLQKGTPPALQPVQFDLEFAGNYGTLLAILRDALKANFQSFFVGSPGFGAIVHSLGERFQKPST